MALTEENRARMLEVMKRRKLAETQYQQPMRQEQPTGEPSGLPSTMQSEPSGLSGQMPQGIGTKKAELGKIERAVAPFVGMAKGGFEGMKEGWKAPREGDFRAPGGELERAGEAAKGGLQRMWKGVKEMGVGATALPTAMGLMDPIGERREGDSARLGATEEQMSGIPSGAVDIGAGALQTVFGGAMPYLPNPIERPLGAIGGAIGGVIKGGAEGLARAGGAKEEAIQSPEFQKATEVAQVFAPAAKMGKMKVSKPKIGGLVDTIKQAPSKLKQAINATDNKSATFNFMKSSGWKSSKGGITKEIARKKGQLALKQLKDRGFKVIDKVDEFTGQKISAIEQTFLEIKKASKEKWGEIESALGESDVRIGTDVARKELLSRAENKGYSAGARKELSKKAEMLFPEKETLSHLEIQTRMSEINAELGKMDLSFPQKEGLKAARDILSKELEKSMGGAPKKLREEYGALAEFIEPFRKQTERGAGIMNKALSGFGAAETVAALADKAEVSKSGISKIAVGEAARRMADPNAAMGKALNRYDGGITAGGLARGALGFPKKAYTGIKPYAKTGIRGARISEGTRE